MGVHFDASWLTLTAPLLVCTGGGLLLLLLEAFAIGKGSDDPGNPTPLSHGWLAMVAVVLLLVAAALEVSAWSGAETPRLIYDGMLVVDRFSIFLGVVFFAGAALSVMLAGGFLREHRFDFGEFYALVLFATAGMLILAHAATLVTLFVGVETMSLAVYVLVGSWRHSAKSSEGAMKYFLVGAFASAVMLYGIALIYGASGTVSLAELSSMGRGGSVPGLTVADPVFLIGMVFLIGGLAFKVAAVPFHMWAPDAYEGAPTPVTAFMAAGVKAAAFGAVVRVFGTAFRHEALTFGVSGWASIASVLAILTMSIGNLAALRQDNVKRMLAYSSIAHAGYLLLGVAAMGAGGAEARGPILYYLTTYTFATIGSFGVVAWFGSRGDERQQLDDWAGMATRHPAGAFAMTLFLLSLGGVPPTGGFFAKLYIFRIALQKADLLPVVIIAVANSLVSVFYYLRVVSTMYFRELGREPTPLRAPGVSAALVVAAVGTLFLGLFPSWLSDIAAAATMYLPK